MSKVAIVTDSNSGITQERGKELGIFVLPMPFFIDGELYLEDITLSQSEFYEKLGADSDISTSQPSPGEVLDLWDKVLEEYDELVCIPMSSGLSSTCATAITLSAEYDGRVQVVDNQRISVTQEQSVLDAMNLREEGKSAAEIKEILEKEKLQASIYITVDTLKYLKKGGRITPAAAAIGTVLNLKPVLQIQGEKLDAFSKARGWKTAKKTMLNAIEKDLNGRFADVKDQMEGSHHLPSVSNLVLNAFHSQSSYCSFLYFLPSFPPPSSILFSNPSLIRSSCTIILLPTSYASSQVPYFSLIEPLLHSSQASAQFPHFHIQRIQNTKGSYALLPQALRMPPSHQNVAHSPVRVQPLVSLPLTHDFHAFPTFFCIDFLKL